MDAVFIRHRRTKPTPHFGQAHLRHCRRRHQGRADRYPSLLRRRSPDKAHCCGLFFGMNPDPDPECLKLRLSLGKITVGRRGGGWWSGRDCYCSRSRAIGPLRRRLWQGQCCCADGAVCGEWWWGRFVTGVARWNGGGLFAAIVVAAGDGRRTATWAAGVETSVRV